MGSPTQSLPLGPVSATLEADLRGWVRRKGVVLWLDQGGHYGAFVEGLAAAEAAGGLPYRVLSFKGSHLELLFALEGVADGVDPSPLVIHLPGFTEEGVRETPLLELYAAGVRYRKALPTLVTEAAAGKVLPPEIEAFKGRPDLTLALADAWLAAALGEATGDVSAELEGLGLPELVAQLRGAGGIKARLAIPEVFAALRDRVGRLAGLPEGWWALTLPQSPPLPGARGPGAPPSGEDLAHGIVSWAMAVEYVKDLRRPPVHPALAPASALPEGVVEACRALCQHLRSNDPAFYQRTADETEALLGEEVNAARAEDLGRIDTFRFEEEATFEAALAALKGGTWKEAAEWAGRRSAGASFWVSQDRAGRAGAWELIGLAAALGLAIQGAGKRLKAESLEGAVGRYTEGGSAVDGAHRRLEQRRHALLVPTLPEFVALRARLDGMRHVWRAWADGWAEDFSALCRARGFLPPAALQQRTLFDDVVRPLTLEAGTTAYFMVDALRYEMAEELLLSLGAESATRTQLKARLAELPTVTDVGMNALTPVAAQGILRPVLQKGEIKGFQAEAFQVLSIETRRRAIHARVGGNTCPWMPIDEVLSRDIPTLRRAVAQARLVVVHVTEIDDGGEKGLGPRIFDSALQRLKGAWHLLREAGVSRFVITADHGFLLLDDASRSAQPHGRKIDGKRRHVVSDIPADHPGEVRVSFQALDYRGAERQIMFPESTAVFDTGRRDMSFVHGGNSLQERVIPVLTLTHRGKAGGSNLSYRVKSRTLEGVGGMHCIEAVMEVETQTGLSFSAREVELTLGVVDEGDVRVEIVQVRGGATLKGGSLLATPESAFEIFFRLAGPGDARVRVELQHPSDPGEVTPGGPPERFTVDPTRATQVARGEGESGGAPHGGTPGGSGSISWLEQLPEGGIRQVFAHLEAHGTITEVELTHMLGSGRRVRGFARDFEGYAKVAPFAVRIESVAGMKRYVREG